ncbi:AhpA/YtjB family protein, partial [Arsenophonus endosymbiont of Bemisia tabaci]|uniref:AhpA/YtjB family protein n=1 Tax=Arsenophonus endosymbiont of Bemisia tabaci TaxID=536059 RepID=UPI001EE19FB1
VIQSRQLANKKRFFKLYYHLNLWQYDNELSLKEPIIIKTKLKFRLHKTVIILICFLLLISNYIQSDGKSFNNKQLLAILNQLTINEHILDASVYLNDGTKIQHAGEKVALRERLSLNHPLSNSYVNYQLVVPIFDTKKPKGFLRLTIDAHQFSIGSKQIDNMANLLRIMLLLALTIGFVLVNILSKLISIHWPKLPFLSISNSRSANNQQKK